MSNSNATYASLKQQDTDAYALLTTVRQAGGFLTDIQVNVLTQHPTLRLTQCLVRCGSCRFVCAAQDVAHLIAIIERDATDYVRDVSLVAPSLR